MLTGEKGSLVRMMSTAFGGGSTAFKFLLESLRAAASPSNAYCCLSKFIVPLAKGQIIRSDIVPLRFVDCEVVVLASSFAEPLQVYSGEPVSRDQLHSLDEILKSSTAGLTLQDRYLKARPPPPPPCSRRSTRIMSIQDASFLILWSSVVPLLRLNVKVLQQGLVITLEDVLSSGCVLEVLLSHKSITSDWSPWRSGGSLSKSP